MEITPRIRIVYLALVFLALILGWTTTIFFDPIHRLPLALRLLLVSLPSIFLPLAIGWLNPERWWTGLAGAVFPSIAAAGALFVVPGGQSQEFVMFSQLAGVLLLLPLITTLVSATFGRRLRLKPRPGSRPGASMDAVPLKRWGILLPILLVALSCAALYIILFLKIPVQVTLKDGQIDINPAVTKGWSGLQFQVENQGSQPHQLIVLISQQPFGQLPVVNGQAQLFGPAGEPDGQPFEILQAGGRVLWEPEESPPDGPPLQPGETRAFPYGYSGMGMAPGELTLTILCNLPGHYEQGEHATLILTE